MRAKLEEMLEYYRKALQLAEGEDSIWYEAKIAALEAIAELFEMEGLY